MTTRGRATLLPAAVVLAGCGAPAPPAGTGGTDVAMGPCGRGLVVVQSDYQSTNVALVGVDGVVLSSSFLSSASADAALSAPLSGDVVVPSEPALGREVVLVDRYPASVLSWVDVRTADVRAQLGVGTGFASNPQDYAALASGAALVTRFETNAAPGAEPFDDGGDVLEVDSLAPAVSGRIDLAAAMTDAPGYLPRANRMVRLGERAYVLLAAYDAAFASSAPSRLAVVDLATGQLVGTTVLGGLHGCGALALAPAYLADGTPKPERQLAVGCSGGFAGGPTPALAESAVVLLSLAAELPVETLRLPAASLGGQPIGFALDFAADGRLLVVALGHFGEGGEPDVTDALLEVDLASSSSRELMRTASRPFELGDVRCTTRLLAGAGEAGCEQACFVADAEAGVLRRLERDEAGWQLAGSVVVGADIGLPPRLLGRF